MKKEKNDKLATLADLQELKIDLMKNTEDTVRKAISGSESTFRREIKVAMLDVKTELGYEIKALGDRMNVHVNSIISHIDHFVGESKKMDFEQAAQAHQIKELREGFSDHEKRLSTLEASKTN